MKGGKVKWGIIIGISLVIAFKMVFRMWEETKGSEVIECFFVPCRQADDMLVNNQLKEDLMYLQKTLEEVHPLTGDGLPEKTLQVIEKYRDIDNISVGDFTNVVNEVLTTLQDSHTSVVPVKGAAGLPIEAVMIDEKLYVVKSRDLCKGDRIIKVGGIPVEELQEKMKGYRAAENKYWLQVQFEETWVDKRFLDYSGVSTVAGKVVVEVVREGRLVERNVHFTNYAYKYKPSRVNEGKGVVSYEINQEMEMCTLILTKCEYSTYYKEVIKKMFKEMKEKEIKHLAIDIRGNGGGNSLVINELIRYLPVSQYKQGGGVRRLSEAAKEQRGYMSNNGELGSKRPQTIRNERNEEYEYEGKVYVLVDKYTYSSALMLATTLKDNGLAEVIGTPTGGKAHSYGDILQFQLPNSAIRYSISYTEWFRTDKKRNNDEWLVPDHEVKYTLDDILGKRDKTKEKLYEIIKGVTCE